MTKLENNVYDSEKCEKRFNSELINANFSVRCLTYIMWCNKFKD